MRKKPLNYCSVHKITLDESNSYSNQWGGTARRCKDCRREANARSNAYAALEHELIEEHPQAFDHSRCELDVTLCPECTALWLECKMDEVMQETA